MAVAKEGLVAEQLAKELVPVGDVLEEARRHFDAGEYQQAERICHQVLKARPAHPGALNQLAAITHRAGAPMVAVALARRAIALDPDNPEFHLTLGAAQARAGRVVDAEATLRHALELGPAAPPILANLAESLIAQGRLAAAHELIEGAIEHNPDDSLLHQVQGVVLLSLARASDAQASFRRAVELAPKFANAHAGVLFAEHYTGTVDPQALADEARTWGARFAEKLTGDVVAHRNGADPGRRLRVGYLSGDFHHHPVGHILQSVLPAHDPAQVEVFCYSNHWQSDDVTRQLRAAVAQWRSIVHLNDEAAAEVIRSDEIDVLIDLSGHTGQSRPFVLARKPAPVQAMWLGYFDTTGMTAIDYVIADRHVCPPGDERFYVEKIARLPHSFVCFTPPNPSPDVAPLPARAAERVTFGCLNNSAKVTTEVVGLWTKILRALPDARLCLKSSALNDPVVREHYVRLFGAGGVDANRLIFKGSTPYAEHLVVYGEIDVGLDPFPYNGGHTTLDALWMGVPVVALRGQRFVSRMGASILSTIGLGELVADSPEQYVETAVALARDLDRLAELRAGLRDLMAASPLCDGAGVARGLEAIYRDIWQAWCRSASSLARES